MALLVNVAYILLFLFKCWILLKPALGVVGGSVHLSSYHYRPWTIPIKPSLQYFQFFAILLIHFFHNFILVKHGPTCFYFACLDNCKKVKLVIIKCTFSRKT
jgi:hypothetical protein